MQSENEVIFLTDLFQVNEVWSRNELKRSSEVTAGVRTVIIEWVVKTLDLYVANELKGIGRTGAR